MLRYFEDSKDNDLVRCSTVYRVYSCLAANVLHLNHDQLVLTTYSLPTAPPS
jgi:hypothetical protein